MTLPTPKMLYDGSRAPNPRRVRIFAAEKGITLPRTEVDIMAKAHRLPEYVQRSGAALIPVLELSDGTALSESVAICHYLEALHPQPNLLGVDGLERATVEMWNRRMEFELLLPIAFVFRHLHPSFAHLEDQCPAWGEANKPKVLDGLAKLNARLSESAFVAGPRFTIADITAWTALDFMRITKIAIPEDHTALLAWYAGCKARPSAGA